MWISDVPSIRRILRTHKYGKSQLFDAFKIVGDNLFSTRDIEFHKVQKRLMLPAYSISALNDLEPMIYDGGVAGLIKRIEQSADAGQAIDIMHLLSCMTFVSSIYDTMYAPAY